MGAQNERQQKILDIINEKGEIQLQQLEIIFPNVSIMTLRRDLISLENGNNVIRVHGGAISIKKVSQIQEDDYSIRSIENIDAKNKIAQKALHLVEKGCSLYFDSGSTTTCLARILHSEPLTIITNGINIAFELVKNPEYNVFTLGGLINHNTLSVSFPTAFNYISDFNIDTAFMAASGFSLKNGFTTSNMYENELKKKIIQKAKKVIVLADSSKINKNMPFTFANMDNIDVLVCDCVLPDEFIVEAKRLGVELI